MRGGWPVTLVSANGRAATLALALHENGFKVQVLDFTATLPTETHHGAGPFPLLNKTYLPAQKEWLQTALPLVNGLQIWLPEGPIALTGPLRDVHAQHHRELSNWLAARADGDFGQHWLARWLKQWASPFFSESWQDDSGPEFPVNEALALLPAGSEARTVSFAHLMAKGLNVRPCKGFIEVRAEGGRLKELVVDVGTGLAVPAEQWVWCLSSAETFASGAEVARQLFWRGPMKPDWVWMSFEGSFVPGPWNDGLPDYSVVMGDVHLPWAHANVFVLRRLSETGVRVWLKVPLARSENIDLRRGWALGIENTLRARLPLAEWRIDSALWSVCAEACAFPRELRGELPGHWKNWDWISAETLPRLDLSARLEREAASFERIVSWRNEQLKKQGVPRDHALHAP